MKIATWNVNSLKSRLELVKEWLLHTQVDFLLLQEIKGDNKDIFKEFEKMDYYSYYSLQKTYNGVAIISKYECEITQSANIPKFEDTQARFLEVRYKDNLIINTYMPNGNPLGTEKFNYKINWTTALYDYIESLMEKNKNFLLAGDFNIAPLDLDVYSIKSFANDAIVHKSARDLYFKMINLGLLDVISFKYKDTRNIYTWWDYRNGSFAKNNGARIDHILLSPKLADLYNDCEIDKSPRLRDKPSDHTPVICSLKFL